MCSLPVILTGIIVLFGCSVDSFVPSTRHHNYDSVKLPSLAANRKNVHPPPFLLSASRRDDSLESFPTAATTTTTPDSGGGAPRYDPDTSSETLILLHFLLSHGAKGMGPRGGTEIGFSGTGKRGLFARKSFARGDVLCQIPSRVVLALSDPDAPQPLVPSMPQQGLEFLRLYQDNLMAAMMFEPYLQSLPTRQRFFDTPTPDFFSPEELEALEDVSVIRQARERRHEMERLAHANGVHVETLQFATWIVSSRGMWIPHGGGHDRRLAVLVPYLDMVNHASLWQGHANVQFQIVDPEKNDAWFTLGAVRDIAVGEEISMDYGFQDPRECLLRYGFVPSSSSPARHNQPCTTHSWSTSLEEDEKELLQLKKQQERFGTRDNSNIFTILQYRIQMKRASMAP